MAQFPINIQTFVLFDGLTPLTYWRCDYISGAWTTPVKILDTGIPATNQYNLEAGQTADGTHLGICISHSVSPPDLTTLQFLGDGIPDPMQDASFGSTQWNMGPGDSSGAFWHNNAYYILTNDAFNNISVIKSSDGGVTWGFLDVAHQPTIISGIGLNAAFRRTGSKIDIIAPTNYNGPDGYFLGIFTFDLDTETWTGIYGNTQAFDGELLSMNSGIGAPWPFSDQVVRFNNGQIAAMYKGLGSNLLTYRVYDPISGLWQNSVTTVGDTTDVYSQIIVDPEDPDTMYVWTVTGSVHASQFRYYSATRTGVVTGPLFTTPVMDVFSGGGAGSGVCMSGIIYFPITNPANAYESVWIGAAGSGSFVESPLPIPAPDVGVTPNVGSYMIEWLSPSLSLACPVTNTFTVGVPFSAQLVATSGTPPYTFSLIGGSLPPGLSLNPTTGVISGTPVSSGSFSYTVEVTDSGSPPATATVTCSLSSGSPNSPCEGTAPAPSTDVQFKLIKVIATLKEATHLPTRGSVK